MCLESRGIDDNDDGVCGRRRAQGLSNNNGGVSGGQGIDDASDGSETTMDAERIQGRRQRLRRCDDRSEKLATTTKASAEEDEPEDLTTTMEVSEEEVEETTRLS